MRPGDLCGPEADRYSQYMKSSPRESWIDRFFESTNGCSYGTGFAKRLTIGMCIRGSWSPSIEIVLVAQVGVFGGHA